jgi:hypothetical protein
MLDLQVDTVQASRRVVEVGIIEVSRAAIDAAEELEQFHWFVRTHLQQTDGSLRTAGTLPSVRRHGAPAADRLVERTDKAGVRR